MNILTERKLSIDSVDTQIDTFIIEFEDKALKNKPVKNPEDAEGAPPEAGLSPDDQMEGRKGISNLLKENIRFLLSEEDEKDIGAKDEKEKTRFKINVNSPPKPNRVPENLDVDTFVANVARLINHSKDLLSVEKVIYNRAMKFLEENYDEDTKNMAEMSIKTNFDVDVQPASEEFDGYDKTAIEREY